MALTAENRERLIAATVAVIDQVRSAYLGTPGANVLRHWDQIQDRVRMAARTSRSAAEWTTALTRSLKLPAPDNYLSRSTQALVSLVTGLSADREWLDLVEREYAYMMALARLRAENRAEARKTKGDK
jgi:hypothetical protein